MKNPRKSRFEVTVEETRSRTYAVMAADEGTAKLVARVRFKREENGIPDRMRRNCIETVVRKSPRYCVEVKDSGKAIVIDLEMQAVVAECFTKDIADTLAETLNQKEENEND